MAVHSRSYLISVFLLLMIFSTGLISYEFLTTKNVCAQESSWFQITISPINIDLDSRSFTAEIKAGLDIPYSISKIECQIENFIVRDVEVHGGYMGRIDGGQAKLTLYEKHGGHYEGNVTAVFRLFGYKEFYPFDSYLLNLTFILPNFGLITQDITNLITFWGEDYGWGGIDYYVTWVGEMAYINSQIVLDRDRGARVISIMPVLAISFLLLGGITLIKPERLEHRLSICLSLFIFSISYSSTMRVSNAGLTLGEVIINVLLFGTGILAFVSIVEKALIEVKPRLSFVHYIFDGFIIVFIASGLTGFGMGGLLANFALMAEVYPWQANQTVAKSIFSGFLAILVIMPYVSKMSISFVYSLWKNRSRLKQA
jgi:hypothetical protein